MDAKKHRVVLSRDMLIEARELLEIRNHDPQYLEDNDEPETLAGALLDVLDDIEDYPSNYGRKLRDEQRALWIALGIAQEFDPSRVAALGRSRVWFRRGGKCYGFGAHVHPSTIEIVGTEELDR
jgi:hypothetical protein